MGKACVVPGCSNRSDRETELSYHRLPLKNKGLLKIWIHKIGRKNLPLNDNSRVCSAHFDNSAGRLLRSDAFPTINLPAITTPLRKRKLPADRRKNTECLVDHDAESETTVTDLLVEAELLSADATVTPPSAKEVAIQTDETSLKYLQLQEEVADLKFKLKKSLFRLSNIKDNDQKVLFYTGFYNYSILKACFDYLGPAANSLSYWGSEITGATKSTFGRARSLPPLEEYFLVLVRLRLGLFEKDLADRFDISVSTVSRICITWINFLYVRFKELPLWPRKESIQSHMPRVFKDLYPTTRVIIDATEIFVETPSLPELQQMTYSNYKHHNTFKSLIGISPGGAIIFVSKLFPGSISDKQLTERSGLLQLIEKGDSIMADRGFDIQDMLTPLGVRVNLPTFLKGKPQLEANELVETRRIASLRIHVERAMERIKNFHILDGTIPLSLTNVAEQIVFVCAMLTNYLPPLCSYK